jgi:hypothetical protein
MTHYAFDTVVIICGCLFIFSKYGQVFFHSFLKKIGKTPRQRAKIMGAWGTINVWIGAIILMGLAVATGFWFMDADLVILSAIHEFGWGGSVNGTRPQTPDTAYKV